MTMIPTATGYDLIMKPPARHRALMTAEQAALCFETKAGQCPQPERGAHYVATHTPAALLAENDARARDWAGVLR